MALRLVQAGDEPAIRQAVADADIQRWVQPPDDYAGQVYRRARQREFFGTGHTWAITVGDRFAGLVGLAVDGDDGGAEIGFWVARPFRRQGIATRAVGLAGASAGGLTQRVTARVPIGNDASVAVLLACGYSAPVLGRSALARRDGHVDCWLLYNNLARYGS